MTAEEYLGRSRLFRCLQSRPDGLLVESYAARLVEDGLGHYGTWRSINLLADLMGWLASSGSKLTDLNECLIEQYAATLAGVPDTGTSLLVVEQDVAIALDLAREGFVLARGRIVLSGPSAALAGDQRVREAYLGL